MVASWPRGYRRSWLRGDVVAGLTVWAVLVPEALAYATIAGVDPVVGLYAAPAALVLYALFGSSRHLIVGPMSATAALSVAAGVAASLLLDLRGHGVALVGHITGGLPPLGPPPVAGSDYAALAAGAVGVALVGFAEGLGAAKTYAARAGYDIDPNRELTGLGAANLGAGLCAGMPVNGSLSKTAVNGGAGARSQVSGLTAAALTVLTLLFLTALFERLPEPVLAAIVIAAVVDLVDFPAIARLYRVWTRRLGRIYGPAARADFLAALAALAGVLVFDTLPGLFLGIGISLLLLLYRASRPNIAELGRLPGGAWVDLRHHRDADTVPGTAVVRVEGGLFFANAERVRFALRAYGRRDEVHAVVLDAGTVPFVDVTAAEMLAGLNRELAREDAMLIVAHDIGQVRDVLAEESGDGRVYRTVDEAVTAAGAAGAGR
nr:SulP family inorganic anion transporter [Actinomadura sp. CNU-125]